MPGIQVEGSGKGKNFLGDDVVVLYPDGGGSNVTQHLC